jgi:hypothetical protein
MTMGTAQERAVEVLNKVYCLGIMDCSPSVTQAIELPENTKRWFYTVTATKSPQKARAIRKDPSVFRVFPALHSARKRRKAEKEAPVYPGDGNCSVYLLKHYEDTEKFVVAGGAYFFYGQYSRKNVAATGMIIDDPYVCKGTQYIGLENSRAFTESYNMYVVLTVIAMTE